MRSERSARFCSLGVLVAVLGSAAPCSAEGCFGGYSCLEAARAATDFRLARDCPDVVAIDAAKRAEFEKIMAAVRTRPLAGLGPDQFTDVPSPLPAAECDRIGREMLSGTPERRAALRFLRLRPAARRRLTSGG